MTMRTMYLGMSALSAALAVWQGYALFMNGYAHLLSAMLATLGAVAWYLIYWTTDPVEVRQISIWPVKYLRCGSVSLLDIGPIRCSRCGKDVIWHIRANEEGE